MGLHLLWCFLLFLWHQQLLQGPLHLQNLKNFVAMPSVHNVRHVRLVYRWRKSAEPGSSIHLIHYPSIPDHLTDVLRSSQRHAAELTLWSGKLVSQMSPRRNSAEGTLTHSTALRSLITSHLILITATPLSGTLKSGMVRWVPRSAAGTESGRRSLSARRTHQSLIMITATPLSGTLKSGMVRWAQESAAGTESGRRSPSARRNHQSLILITATPLPGTLKSGMVRWAPRSAAGTVTGSVSLSAMVVTRMIKLFCFCDYIPLAQAQVQWKKKAHVNFVRCKITM